MKARGITMTVYVDDLTLSGAHSMHADLCAVKKSFPAVGLSCHKTRSFPKQVPKLITGTIFTSGGLRLPNRRHLRTAMNIGCLETASSHHDLQAFRARLLGQMTEAARADDHWKARLHGYKSLVSRIALATEGRLGDTLEQP
jgi:hypothetical protein